MEEDPELEVRLSLSNNSIYISIKSLSSEVNSHTILCDIFSLVSCFCQKNINDYLEATAIALPISRRQQAHITYSGQVQPHYSMMKTITQNLHGIVKEEENLRASMTTTEEQEFCDSDWVIV